MKTTVPEFAILGHPNEGKSSVLSTLAEDDSVRISSTPGETTECRTFPVSIDGREILRFTDTPGFQNPARVLSYFKKLEKHGDELLREFRSIAEKIPELHDDLELLTPIERGAGIIYVVDGSRPLRNVDKMEMEILRLTGKPRMAIINCKDDNFAYLDDWKMEFRKNFNSNQLFNAHRATYAERIRLLEALKSIDQDWYDPLSRVIDAFRQEWRSRNSQSADIIIELLTGCLTLKLTSTISSGSDEKSVREKLFVKYKKKLEEKEKAAQEQIRALFKHNIFNYQLPSHSLLRENILDEKNWQLLGLTPKQVIIAGGLGGATLGATLDLATLGHSLGLFAAIGGVAGALGAMFSGENLSGQAEILGIPLGGEVVQVGPAKNIEMLFVLLNRALLHYRHIINWAHGRRDYPPAIAIEETNRNYTKDWSTARLKTCQQFFQQLKDNGEPDADKREAFRIIILESLEEISGEKNRKLTQV